MMFQPDLIVWMASSAAVSITGMLTIYRGGWNV